MSIVHGVIANGSFPGQYGAFSPCNANVQLSWLMNKYYIAQNKVAGACNFGGQASLQSAQAASGTCLALLNEAGSQGTGQVTSTNGGSGSGSGSKSAASGTFGDFRILAAIVAAFLGGIALVVV